MVKTDLGITFCHSFDEEDDMIVCGRYLKHVLVQGQEHLVDVKTLQNSRGDGSVNTSLLRKPTIQTRDHSLETLFCFFTHHDNTRTGLAESTLVSELDETFFALIVCRSQCLKFIILF